MDINTAIALRRSIRKFKPDPVSKEQVRELLEAARMAPSGTNHQPWRFVVIRNLQIKNEVQAAAFGQRHIGEAPVILVCCADITTYSRDTRSRVVELIEAGAMDASAIENYPGLNSEKDAETLKGYIPHAMLNVALAMENIVLKAVSMGLGTCIVQLMKSKKIAQILELPENIIITALIPVGYPDEEPAQRPRLKLEDLILKEI